MVSMGNQGIDTTKASSPDFGAFTDENIAFLRKFFQVFDDLRRSYGLHSLNMAEAAAIALTGHDRKI